MNNTTRMENADTPGTKKRKADEMETMSQPMDGITPIGMNFVNATRKTLPQQLNNQEQMFPPMNYQQQQQRFQNQQPQRRRTSALVFGNAKHGENVAEQYQFSADVNLVASGVSKDATMDQLKEFIDTKGIKCNDESRKEGFAPEVFN